jgi:general secretion pathway protein G
MVIFMNDANVFVTHRACVTRGYAEKRRIGFAGFTLIELLVVLAIIAMLISVAMPRYFQSIDVAKETTLAENLRATRETIDKFYGDTGQYPESLDQLKEKNYLRAVPVDPVTESAQTWIIVPPQAGVKGKVFNIRSGATGNNRLGQAFADM